MLCCLNFSKKEILLWNSSSDTRDNSQYLEALKKYINHVSKSFTASPANNNKKNNGKENGPCVTSPFPPLNKEILMIVAFSPY
jgi:hypothetical protein